MKLIMPMAGRARRFNDKSDELIIKPLIEIHGKPLFQWAISSLEIPAQMIFIIQREHFALKNKILQIYPGSQVIEIDHYTSGPVETLTHAFEFLKEECSVIVCDCDFYFKSPQFEDFLSKGDDIADSGVLTFKSQSPSYSYVQISEANVTEIKEKEVISSNAVCGCYYFKSSSNLITYSHEAMKRFPQREVFMSDVIRQSIEQGDKVRAFQTELHVSLGTPAEISENQKKLP